MYNIYFQLIYLDLIVKVVTVAEAALAAKNNADSVNSVNRDH